MATDGQNFNRRLLATNPLAGSTLSPQLAASGPRLVLLTGRRCHPSKPRPPELQIRAESRVTIEPYTERHTIFVMSEVSAARLFFPCESKKPGANGTRHPGWSSTLTSSFAAT